MHVCPECGKKMATNGGLEIHMELAHRADAAPVQDEAVESAAPAAIDVVPLERPRQQSNRVATPVLFFAIVALLVAGVASALVRNNESPTTPLAMVQASATATAGAHTTQMHIAISGGSGLFKNFSEDGGFDFENRRFRVQIDMAQFGDASLGKVDGIADYSNGLIEYVHLPAEVADQAGGKPWIKIDLQTLFQKLGIDANLGAILQGQSGDPTQGLSMVRGAENVVKVGTDQVRGVDTTHYHLDVNLQKAVDQQPTPEARTAMQQLVNLYTVPTDPLDVWLDNDGRIRQLQRTLDFSVIRFPASIASKIPQLGKPTFTAQFYDFGSSVDTKLPAPDQVTDFNDLH